MHASRNAMTDPRLPHHITCVVQELLPLFSQPELVSMVFDSWRLLREQCGLRLYAYVIMEEHLHFLARAEWLDGCLERFREETSDRILAFLEQQRLERFLKRLPRDGEGRCRLWQQPVEQETVGEGIMGKVIDYIHINPVKRGYVEAPEQWRYSSARDYAGERGLVEIDRWEGESFV
jgi:REP element-mobilizing transposase RayT